MQNDVVTLKRIGKKNDIVKISIDEGVDIANAVPQLSQLIDNCYKNNVFKIILDMQRIKFPSSSFIALLIEKTVQARRVNGELKLINLAPSAINNLVTFSTLNYLSTEENEVFAMEELEVLAVTVNASFQSGLPTSENNKEIGFKTKSLEKLDSPIEKLNIPEKKNESMWSNTNPSKKHCPKMPEAENAGISDSGSQIFDHKPSAMSLVNQEKASEPVLTKKPEIVQQQKSSLVTKRIRVKSQIDSLYDICDFVTNLADFVGFSEKEVGKIKVTVYEACLNVIEHAYHSDPDEWIVVTVQHDAKEFHITIQDWGQSFNFDDSKPYDVNQAVQDRQTGGFGLFIIRRSMDNVKYRTDPVNGNRLMLTKNIPINKSSENHA